MSAAFSTLPDGHGLVFIQPSRSAGNMFFAVLQETFGEDHCFKLGLVGEKINTYRDFLAAAPTDAFTFYGGHFCFGIDRHIPRPCDYAVSLRDPVVRLLSRYEATCRIAGQRPEWEAWLDRDFESNNGVVKRLLGVGFQDDEAVTWDVAEEREFEGEMNVGAAEYAAAMAVMRERVAFPLFKEHIEASLLKVRQFYATAPLFSVMRQNINHAIVETRVENYPPEVIAMITERNRHDIALYEACQSEFEAFRAAQDPAFHEEVRIMKIVSVIVSDNALQILDDGTLQGRFYGAIGEMLDQGRENDAAAVIGRFVGQPYTGLNFCRGCLKLLQAIGAADALKVNIETYKAKFGGDAFLAEFGA